ncbi:hypothetical protein [Calycomorphotria hydatis]|uniref:Uncharacterized protein n=1 Tax=Calycomorphotria hydatis TaxID=2528027 RepID=A0A517T8T4_9PLAN|nr:hypothetical protein [Calycomorphotria hydatis]QDT64790.1 hypothetical protein V22_20330 [Calycomorphotria hydatis]
MNNSAEMLSLFDRSFRWKIIRVSLLSALVGAIFSYSAVSQPPTQVRADGVDPYQAEMNSWRFFTFAAMFEKPKLFVLVKAAPRPAQQDESQVEESNDLTKIVTPVEAMRPEQLLEQSEKAEIQLAMID